jgi:hypothetical protein
MQNLEAPAAKRKSPVDSNALRDEVNRLLAVADAMPDADRYNLGAINWADLGVVDIEVRSSLQHPESWPIIVVMIEEASPDCRLPRWLADNIDREKYAGVQFECAW